MLRPRSTDFKLGPDPNRAPRGGGAPATHQIRRGDSPSVLATTRPGPSTTATASATAAHHLTAAAAAIPTRAQSGPHHLTGAWGGRAPSNGPSYAEAPPDLQRSAHAPSRAHDLLLLPLRLPLYLSPSLCQMEAIFFSFFRGEFSLSL